jgi:hypothetical protein
MAFTSKYAVSLYEKRLDPAHRRRHAPLAQRLDGEPRCRARRRCQASRRGGADGLQIGRSAWRRLYSGGDARGLGDRALHVWLALKRVARFNRQCTPLSGGHGGRLLAAPSNHQFSRIIPVLSSNRFARRGEWSKGPPVRLSSTAVVQAASNRQIPPRIALSVSVESLALTLDDLNTFAGGYRSARRMSDSGSDNLCAP